MGLNEVIKPLPFHKLPSNLYSDACGVSGAGGVNY